MMKNHRSNNIAFSFSLLLLLLIVFPILLVVGVPQQIRCPIESLYQFGDSIADTGNTIRLYPLLVPISRRPYGETFPGRPTGRSSDGRLIIDYLAGALRLPLLNAYLDKGAAFENGVNFAVAASTALDLSFFLSRGITRPPLPPLSVQLDWFKTHLKSICSSPAECADKLSKSLMIVGESGYNDIGYSTLRGKSIQEISTYIPFVVEAITSTTRELIRAGASQVIVIGNFPLGCFPWVVEMVKSNDATSYDELGCLKSYNNLTTSLNNQLQQDLASLRIEFPQAVILYGDYYNSFLSIFRNASSLGFDARVRFTPCCGEATYNYLSPKFCGNLLANNDCPNPNRFIYFDAIHPTQEVYRLMSQILFRDLNINCTTP